MKEKSMDSGKNNRSNLILILIILIVTLGQSARDIFLPSLPAIANYFSIGDAACQWMLTTYLLGFALSQLIYGPISDYYGRRIVLIIGFIAFILSSLISTFAPSAYVLILSRLLEGMSIGVAPVLARSVMFDYFHKNKLMIAAGYLSMASSLTPAIAPLLGGYVQRGLGWRANFGFLVIYGIVILSLIFFLLPETNESIQKTPLNFKATFKEYVHLFLNHDFMAYALCIFLIGATLSAYNATLPFLTQNLLGLTPVEYGWVGMALVSGFLSGVLIGRKIIDIIRSSRLVLIGLCVVMLSALTMLIISLLGFFNLLVLIIPIMMIMFGCGLMHPIAMVGAVRSIDNSAGILAAALGCLGMLGGAISSNIMSYFPIVNQTPLATVILILAILITIQFYSFLRKKISGTEKTCIS